VTRTLTGILLVFMPVPLTMLILSRLVDRSARIVWPQVLVGAICFLAYRFFVHRVEKRPMIEFSREGALRELAVGLLLGSLLASTLFAVLAVGGVYRLEGFDGMSLEVLRRTATAILVGMHEEMLLRGIVFSIMEQSLGSGLGLIGSAILFGLGHLPSEGATVMAIVNSAAGGITLGAAYMLTRRLWFAFGIHFAWNFTQSGIFGIAVSGNEPMTGILQSTLSGPEWISGGAFGAEASIVAVVLCVALGIYFVYRAGTKGNITQPYWKRTGS